MLIDTASNCTISGLSVPSSLSEEKNSLTSASSTSQSPSSPVNLRNDGLTYSRYVQGNIFSLPKNWELNHNNNHLHHGDALLISVYKFVKTLLGTSGNNQGAIDNRIEQAMDLVKSHLMNAVRSEVEELKEKIVKLEDIVNQLQSENELLKANIPQDVMASLPQIQQQQQQPPPPPSSQSQQQTGAGSGAPGVPPNSGASSHSPNMAK